LALVSAFLIGCYGGESGTRTRPRIANPFGIGYFLGTQAQGLFCGSLHVPFLAYEILLSVCLEHGKMLGEILRMLKEKEKMTMGSFERRPSSLHNQGNTLNGRNHLGSKVTDILIRIYEP
jgi:hypothetical protein